MTDSTPSNNLVWHGGFVRTEELERRNGHRGMVLWLTGLSGAGKSTLAQHIERLLFESGHYTKVLDGDNVRHGLNRDLGFSPAERHENIRRVGEVAKLFRDSGAIVIAAFISPYRTDRTLVRGLFAPGDFCEIYVKCPLQECMRRDPKGAYRKAVAGQLPGYTGVSAPYEEPDAAELTVDTEHLSPDASAQRVITFLRERKVIHT